MRTNTITLISTLLGRTQLTQSSFSINSTAEKRDQNTKKITNHSLTHNKRKSITTLVPWTRLKQDSFSSNFWKTEHTHTHTHARTHTHAHAHTHMRTPTNTHKATICWSQHGYFLVASCPSTMQKTYLREALLKPLYVLPHWKSCRINLLSHPVT